MPMLNQLPLPGEPSEVPIPTEQLLLTETLQKYWYQQQIYARVDQKEPLIIESTLIYLT